jgi:hypothetical protein
MPYRQMKTILQARNEHLRLELLNQDSSCARQSWRYQWRANDQMRPFKYKILNVMILTESVSQYAVRLTHLLALSSCFQIELIRPIRDRK